jgi:hypothetical protein
MVRRFLQLSLLYRAKHDSWNEVEGKNTTRSSGCTPYTIAELLYVIIVLLEFNKLSYQ